MKMKESFNLYEYNTLKTPTITRGFFEFIELEELVEFSKSGALESNDYFILGGGSNVLFKSDFDGVVLHPKKDDIEIKHLDDGAVLVKAYAGLNWDKLVKKTVEQGFVGLENLSLIPGNVGASPVQNIGAYGSEVSNYIYEVECYDLNKGESVFLSNDECCFSYRDSIFKLKSELIVISVTYKLYRSNRIKYLNENKISLSNVGLVKEVLLFIKLCFKSIKFGKTTNWGIKFNFDYLRELLSSSILPANVKRKLVIAIRKKAMPDPSVKPNAGCFFKSPIIDLKKAETLTSLNENISLFSYKDDLLKVSAGDLIRNCVSDKDYESLVCVDKRRPIIVINNGGASGEDIYMYSQNIINIVNKRYNIKIEPEVVII